MAQDVTMTFSITMKQDQMDAFKAMLRRMVFDGNIGHSEYVGFYVDGDGNCRPKVSILETNENGVIEKTDIRGHKFHITGEERYYGHFTRFWYP